MNPNQDALQRINFLYQAAHCMLLQNPENTTLARFYITTMKNVAKKAVLRIHPNIKRTVCKRCDLLLVPGLTSKVRVRGKRQKHVVVTCLECGGVKRFLSNNNYKLWVEKPECTQNPVVGVYDPVYRQYAWLPSYKPILLFHRVKRILLEVKATKHEIIG